MLFTASAVVLQPVTGIALAVTVGYPLSSPWLVWSMVLYGLAGCCWLPVVWLQKRMQDLAIEAAAKGSALPAPYQRYYRWWLRWGGRRLSGCW
jgi:uncharacterized membrane protein